MSNPEEAENIFVNNDSALQTLVRAIRLSQGEFSLTLLHCNYAPLRQQMVERLHQISPVKIREISLPASVKTLYTAISDEIGQEHPSALMVFGLESVQDINRVLTSANQVREEFRKNFHFPMFLWVNDQVLKKLIRLATDLENWSTVIPFDNTNDDLLNFLQQKVEQIFSGTIIPNFQIRWELETAHQELQNREQILDLAIQASLEFVFGFYDYLNDQLYSSEEHYQQSLKFWQESNNLERQGILLINIGLVHKRKGEINQTENQEFWIESRNYLQQSIQIFEQIHRPDLVAKYINILGEVCQKLKVWTDLEGLAQKAIVLHQTYNLTLQLAQDYGFLAETALEESRWEEANQFAEQAIQLLAHTPNISQTRESFYWFLLARSQQGLGNIQTAILNLETAKQKSNHQYDPQLYIAILEKLRLLKFEEKQYSAAFHLKLEQLQIEHQYGFRAFIGASYLRPQRQALNPERLEVENPATIAQEIAASGRGEDVKRLRERISRNDHKLTVIHGQSGVGKSSILQGGLIPALQQESIGDRIALPILLRVYTDWVGVLSGYLSKNEISLNSPADILEQLRKNANRNFLTVLIFDQFEEFFFVYTDPEKRRPFYDFLQECLNISFVKIILSLREDYLHYLLELDRLFDLSVINNNILDKNIRYHLGNFSPADAKIVVQSLTEKTHFYLEPALINKLVEDLAIDIGEVRPIELQIIGTQLQTDKITTLEKYQQFGTKEKLVERFLEEVIKDCGSENETVARLVLYLLTDENENRPLKTYSELTEDLTEDTTKLNLVLEIFVESGLVLLLPESPSDRYQLVHDYLVSFIRQQQGSELLSELKREREQRQLIQEELTRTEASRKILSEAKQKADEKVRKGQNRLALSSSLAIVLLVLASVSSVYSLNKIKEADSAKKNAEKNVKQAQITLKEALKATELERAGVNALKQFDFTEIESLVSATQTAKELKSLVKDGRSLEKYPAFSPIYALHTILLNIKERNQFSGHQGYVNSVSFSPDGKTIATASSDNTARLWNLQGQQIQEFKGHQGYVNSVSFSPDGKTIATASSDNTARLWNLQGQQIQEFKGHQGYVNSVSFSPDGKTIATASSDNTARLWNLQGQQIQEFKGHQGYVNSVSFSPDGKTIATASDDKTARLWNLQGQQIQEFKGHQRYVNSVSFSPDGQTIATASSDGTARLWNLEGEQIQEFKGHQHYVRSVSFSPDGKTIATASSDGTARLWNLQGQQIQEFKGHQGSVWSVSFSPDGKTIATASDDKTARLWNLQGQQIQEFKGHQSYVISVSFSPDGKTIATASSDETARLWNLQGQQIQEFKVHQGYGYVNSVSFSPDGKTIATASSDNTARLWNLQGQQIQEFKGHQHYVRSVSFSPDGKTIATASSDNTARLWNLQGQQIQEFKGHQRYGSVNSVSFSPDGKTIATASSDNTARLWNLQGQQIQEFKGHQGYVNSVSFSPDGKTIATASDDKTARLWNLQGQQIQEFKGHQRYGSVNSVSFSPDGKTIATASSDKTARLWNLQGQQIQEFKGHQGYVNSVSFSPDGKTIATASDDETARLWPVENLDQLLVRGCNWLHDYLTYNPNVRESDRHLCDDITTTK